MYPLIVIAVASIALLVASDLLAIRKTKSAINSPSMGIGGMIIENNQFHNRGHYDIDPHAGTRYDNSPQYCL